MKKFPKIFSSFKKNILAQQIHFLQLKHDIAATRVPHLQNYNVTPSFPKLWIVSLTHSVLRMLYWQPCCNVEIGTANSQRLHNVDTMASNSQRCTDVASTLDSKFTSKHIML